MGNNDSRPEVGKGATVMHWTDRSAYEVIEVSPDGLSCTLQRYQPERADNYGMSDSQGYKYETLTEEKMHLVYRRGAWYQVGRSVDFKPSFLKEAKAAGFYFIAKYLTPEQHEEIYQGETWPRKVVEGITYLKKTYYKINVLFGVKQEYYDYSF